jgi:hypothetical protein
MSSESKVCIKCGQLKLSKFFYKEKRVSDGLTARCKDCMRSDATTSYQSRKEEVLASHKEKYSAKKERAKSLMSSYGLTTEEWNEMFARQNHRCEICGSKEPLHSSGNFVVDHCHSLNFVRGILCGPCNTMLGQAKDDPNTLFEAAMYLISRTHGEPIEERHRRHGHNSRSSDTSQI